MRGAQTNPGMRPAVPVSYTHLDVYKRQATEDAASEEAALEAAEDDVEEAPQPTSRLSAREAATTQEKTLSLIHISYAPDWRWQNV